MTHEILEADYVIVGAGAVGMTFADTLLAESDATIIMIDRRHAPGGHWNDAYPFVRLHSPSAAYGVGSVPLGQDRIDASGQDAGMQERAGAAEICAYFDRVMRQRLLPSGRVFFLPSSDYGPGGKVTCRFGGAPRTVQARRRVVDATFADTRIPATHAPAFAVAPGVQCVSPGELARHSRPATGHVVIGGGKTAMDTVVWLLEQGAAPDTITWIRPRDSWLLDRSRVQTDLRFFARTIGGFAAEFEAARDALSVDDLFARLEMAGQLRRIDPTVEPTMYRCAIVSGAELALMRQVTRVVRLGRVQAIEPHRILLDRGSVPTSPDQVHIHCCADGIPRRPPQPMFQPGRIVPQYVRHCSPTFSAALVAHVETRFDDDASKNALCAPVTLPDEPLDWLRMLVQEARNAAEWRKHPDIRQWLAACRLNAYAALMERGAREPMQEHKEILRRFRDACAPALERLAQLLAHAEGAAAQRRDAPAHGTQRPVEESAARARRADATRAPAACSG